MSKYHKGDKFIVEIKESINSDNGTLYRSNFKTLTFDDNGLDKLQKYEQPTISEDTLEMERMKALNEGRNEVWELANKIQGLDCNIREKIYGIYKMPVIFEKFTPQEALVKLEAYEKEQNEIKVGDIVYNDDTMEEGVVTHIDNDEVFMLYDDGSCGNTYGNLTKTGKHIDIQSVLKQIGGDADELS